MAADATYPLGPGAGEFERMMASVTECATSVIEGIPSSRASASEGAAEVVVRLAEDVPSPATLSELLADLRDAGGVGLVQAPS